MQDVMMNLTPVPGDTKRQPRKSAEYDPARMEELFNKTDTMLNNLNTMFAGDMNVSGQNLEQ